MTNAAAIQGQSIFDVALNFYGSLDGLEWLIGDNPNNLDTDGIFSGAGASFRVRPDVKNRTAQAKMAVVRPVSIAEVIEPPAAGSIVGFAIVGTSTVA